MKTVADWSAEAFFDLPEPGSLDGGTTDHGPLWHAISPRWGHSMHSMCPYHGMFPPRLAHYFIQTYSRPGDLVADPFSGRGTTTLQARVEGRRTLSNDLSPLAYVLTAAKANPPSWAEVSKLLNDLERKYKGGTARELDVSEDIRMLFHDRTLRQLLFLRDFLLSTEITKWTPPQLMLAGTVAGILHGAHRSDGSSMYLSISMPNTFSMPPTYVRNFIRDKHLVKIDQNVFERIRDKLARVYLDATPGPSGRTFKQDAGEFMKGRRRDSIDLIVTSPPYLRVVNYGTSNWIRLWWLGVEEVSRHAGVGRRALDAELDHRHTYESYKEFMLRTLATIRRSLKPNGVAVLVIGDVAGATGPSCALATRIWEDIGSRTGLRLLDRIADSLPAQNKVSRIWGDTKGKATDSDHILLLARTEGEPEALGTTAIDWDEPYRDGGPDAAHARLRELVKESTANRRRPAGHGLAT